MNSRNVISDPYGITENFKITGGYSIMNTTANRNTAALTGIFTTNVLATVNPNNIKNGVLYLGYSVEFGEGVLMKIAPDCVLFGPVKKTEYPKKKKGS